MKGKWFSLGLVGAVALALLAVTAGVAVATTLVTNGYTDADGKYHGCVAKKDGVLRVVSPGDSCNKNEDAIDWNQVGPEGPPGPPRQFISRLGTVAFADPDGFAFPQAFCADGEQAIAGGYGGNVGLEMIASLPLRADGAFAGEGDVGVGWQYTLHNSTTETLPVTARVICASN